MFICIWLYAALARTPLKYNKQKNLKVCLMLVGGQLFDYVYFVTLLYTYNSLSMDFNKIFHHNWANIYARAGV